MENKKNILLVIIVLALGIAVVLFGRSFFAGGGLGTEAITAPSQNILPFGASLDFSKVDQFNKNKRTIVYPQVSPSEIGLGIGQMVR